MAIYVVLAVADGMFPEYMTATRRPISAEEARSLVESGVQSGCNPSHRLTLDALASRFDIHVPIPEKAPFIKLGIGDKVIVLSTRFPRRLAEGEVWSPEDVAQAVFKFSLWEVIA